MVTFCPEIQLTRVKILSFNGASQASPLSRSVTRARCLTVSNTTMSDKNKNSGAYLPHLLWHHFH